MFKTASAAPDMLPSMAETKYNGSCHCGAVKFEVTTEVEGLMECNCSMCSRAGWRLIFVPEAAVEILQGEDALQDYQFGKRNTHHAFCRTCGVRSLSWGPGHDGAKMYAVNTRCLEGFDGAELPVQHFDGAAL